MQGSLEKAALNPARLHSAPALVPNAPRGAHPRSAAIAEEPLKIPQHAPTGYAVRDRRGFGAALNRKNCFARLLEALHESRRLQAASLMHRYRHLLQDNGKAGQGDQSAIASRGKLDMANGDPLQVHLSKPSNSLDTPRLMILAVVGFGILHLMGGILVSRASHERPAESSLPAIRGD